MKDPSNIQNKHLASTPGLADKTRARLLPYGLASTPKFRMSPNDANDDNTTL